MRIHFLAAAAGIATALSIASCGPKADSSVAAETPASAPVPAPSITTGPAPVRSTPELGAATPEAVPSPLASASPAPRLSFRQELLQGRKRIPSDPETRVVDLWIHTLSQCLTSDETTSGDRFLCMDTLLDPRLKLDQVSYDRKLAIASAIAAPFVRGKLPASASGRILAFEALTVIGGLRLEATLPMQIRDLIRTQAAGLVDKQSAQIFVGESKVRAAELERLARADTEGAAQ